MRTDEQLMVAYARGESAAFDELTRRHWHSVFGFLRRLLKNEAVAEEVLATAFFKLHRSALTYSPQAKFTTFLYTIAYREAVSALRADRHARHTVSMSDGYRDRGPVRQLQCARPTPEANREQRELLEHIDRLLLAMPETHRAAFVLYYREGMPVADIAQALDIQPSSVRAYLTFARRALREGLAEADEPCAVAR